MRYQYIRVQNRRWSTFASFSSFTHSFISLTARLMAPPRASQLLRSLFLHNQFLLCHYFSFPPYDTSWVIAYACNDQYRARAQLAPDGMHRRLPWFFRRWEPHVARRTTLAFRDPPLRPGKGFLDAHPSSHAILPRRRSQQLPPLDTCRVSGLLSASVLARRLLATRAGSACSR